MINLTTYDRNFLKAAKVDVAEPSPRADLLDRMVEANLSLRRENERLLKAQGGLIGQRDYWYRCCRMAVVFGVLTAAAWLLREILLAGGML